MSFTDVIALGDFKTAVEHDKYVKGKVMKSVLASAGIRISKPSMYRSLNLAAAEELNEDKKSYELIQPYAGEFKKLGNKGFRVVSSKYIATAAGAGAGEDGAVALGVSHMKEFESLTVVFLSIAQLVHDGPMCGVFFLRTWPTPRLTCTRRSTAWWSSRMWTKSVHCDLKPVPDG